MGITMRGDQLPYQDHISRYCAPKTLADGQPTGTSFMLRQDEEYLSVNWLEYFGHIGMSAQINQIREHIELSLASSGLFAVLNIGETIDYIQSNSENISPFYTSRHQGILPIVGFTIIGMKMI